MRLSGTKTGSANQYNGLGDQLYDLGGARPTLDLNFASNGSLVDSVTGKTLVTHTRASNATYVDGDGIIKDAVTNLVTYSEDVSQWNSPFNTTLTTDNIAAPDGAITADRLLETTATNLHACDGTGFTFVTGTTYTYSVFVKPIGDRNFEISFPAIVFTARFARFTLSGSGSVQGTDAGVTASISSLPNGWYRCVATSTCTSGAGSRIGNFINDSSNSRSYTGDTSAGIYIWGAQLEEASTAGEYVKTTSTLNSAPRFDHKVTRTTTNLLTYSEDFSTWIAGNTTVTVDSSVALAPDGTATADKVVETATTGTHDVFRNIGNVSITPYTVTVYAKPGTVTKLRVGFGYAGLGGGGWARFDLSNGTLIGTTASGADPGTNLSASITAVGNQWYRCSFTVTPSVTTSNYFTSFALLDSSGNASYAGNTTNNLYLWGAQLEQNSDVGPYVKTTGAAATKVDAEPLGLLVEESRTNLITYSEDLTGSNWKTYTGGTGSAPVITSNYGIAPDGTQTADRLVLNLNGGTAGADQSQIYNDSFFSVTGQPITQSVYLKTTDGSTKYVRLSFSGVNPELLTVTGEWQRFDMTLTSAPDTVRRFRLNLRGDFNTSDSADLLVWGAQVEIASFPTSYIRTGGSTVTRSADVTSIEGNDFGTFNLVQYSEEFDQLPQSLLSVTPNAITAPDGNLTADKLVLNATGHAYVQVYSATVSASNAYGYINLNTGVSVKQAGSWGGSTVTDVGNGWWYITVTSDQNYTLSFYAKKGEVDYATWQLFTVARIGVSDASNIFNTTASGGAYIWGAQLEQSSTATPYVKSDVTWTSRASNATYYDYTGTLRKSSYNLYLRSEEFDNASVWSKPASTIVTANQIEAPDGTVSADLINGTGNDNFINQAANLVSGTTYTISMYVKSAGLSKDTFRLGGDSIQFSSDFTATNSWQRFTYTFTATATGSRNNFLTRDSSNNPLGLYIWGAQLETGPYAGDYVKTEGSAASSARNVAFLPDGSGNFVSAGELLLEDAGTNLLPYSEAFDQYPSWTGQGIVTTANQATAPDGTTTAELFKENTTTAPHGTLDAGSSGVSGTTYTFSVYVKPDTATAVQLLGRAACFSGNSYANFNLATGSLGTVGSDATASIKDAGNGWYRCIITATATGTATGAWAIALINNDDTLGRYAAYTGTELQLYLWGAQNEANAYATSYIPTYGSSATRAADVSSSSSNTFGNSFYNQTEGTVNLKAQGLMDTTLSGNRGFVAFSDGSYSNFIHIVKASGGASWKTEIYSGGSSQFSAVNGTYAQSISANISLGFEVNNVTTAFNGSIGSTDTSALIPTVDRLELRDATGSANGHPSGLIKRLTVWPTRLSDDTLKTITA